MKYASFGAVCMVAVASFTGSAFAATDEGGYDPLALDRFIAASLTDATVVSTSVPSAFDLFATQEPTIVAQDAGRFDSEGYLNGPDGERVMKPLKPRWRVGVFR